MKPQDILFFVIILALVFVRKPKLFVISGLLSLLLSIPLFAKHIFFTAQHLVYYAAGFFLIATILLLVQHVHENRN